MTKENAGWLEKREIKANKGMKALKGTWERKVRGAILGLKASREMKDLKDLRVVRAREVRPDQLDLLEKRASRERLDLRATLEVQGKKETKVSKGVTALLVQREREAEMAFKETGDR